MWLLLLLPLPASMPARAPALPPACLPACLPALVPMARCGRQVRGVPALRSFSRNLIIPYTPPDGEGGEQKQESEADQ